MADHVSPEVRSRIMASVHTKNSKPEITLRRVLFRRGYRYRLHRKDLPGSPDLVFVGLKKVIFVHGCFWHGHDCRWGRLPKSNLDYWRHKIETNRTRDQRAIKALRVAGWSPLVVWQCQLPDIEQATKVVVDFLEGG